MAAAEMRLMFEVTFEIFEEKFYNRMAVGRQYRSLSANTVWTEIYSVIKGGEEASKRIYGYVSSNEYIRTAGSSYLTGGEKRTIYYAFLSYEKWKSNVGAYDFMDVVHHVWKNRYTYYNWSTRRSIITFDYLLVDEVQDLPPKVLQLLLYLTKQQVFFAGDTA